jgi:hypothetical protein
LAFLFLVFGPCLVRTKIGLGVDVLSVAKVGRYIFDYLKLGPSKIFRPSAFLSQTEEDFPGSAGPSAGNKQQKPIMMHMRQSRSWKELHRPVQPSHAENSFFFNTTTTLLINHIDFSATRIPRTLLPSDRPQ